jgi:hypothetical protein
MSRTSFSRIGCLLLLVPLTGCRMSEEERTIRDFIKAANDLADTLGSVQDAPSARAALADLDARWQEFDRLQKTITENRQKYDDFKVRKATAEELKQGITQATARLIAENERLRALRGLPGEFWKIVTLRDVAIMVDTVAKPGADGEVASQIHAINRLCTSHGYERVIWVELNSVPQDLAERAYDRLQRAAPGATLCHVTDGIQHHIVLGPAADFKKFRAAVDLGSIVFEDEGQRMIRVEVDGQKLAAASPDVNPEQPPTTTTVARPTTTPPTTMPTTTTMTTPPTPVDPAPKKPIEPEVLANLTPREAADELVKRFGAEKVVRIVVRGLPALRNDPQLTAKLAKMCDRGEKPHIFISTGEDPFGVVVAPVSFFPPLITFGIPTEADPAQRKLVVSSREAVAKTINPSAFDPPKPATPSGKPADRDPLSAALAEIRGGERMRHFAIDRVAAMPVDEKRRAEVAELLVSSLKDSDTFVRTSALGALGKWWTAETLPALVALVDDQNTGVRWKVMDALAATKTPEAAKAIAGRVGQDKMFAAKALMTMGPVAEPVALQLLSNKDDFVRREACQILQSVGTKKSLARVKALSRDKNPLVAMAAKAAADAIQNRK